jgi:hypothetical protein
MTTQMIERLRAIKESEAAESSERGDSDGLEWAAEIATPDELKRLTNAWGEDLYDEDANGSNFLAIIEGRRRLTGLRHSVRHLRGDHFIDVRDDDGAAYWNAFAAAAVAAWEAVADQVEA